MLEYLIQFHGNITFVQVNKLLFVKLEKIRAKHVKHDNQL